MRKTLRIATRKSPLALWQAEFVRQRLLDIYPDLTIELLKFTTSGDKFLNQSLAKIGGKGLFTKELEDALLKNEADLAVHSMKDVQTHLPKGLCLATLLKREDARDALITKNQIGLLDLPEDAIIGTSSLRRAVQIKALKPNCQIKPLRGNINTRLSKLESFDAIILAAIGLHRLNFENKICHYLSFDESIPAAGQGALGIECRQEDTELLTMLSKLNCKKTEQLVHCERHFNALLNGRCDVPIAAHATEENGQITLSTMVGCEKTNTLLKASASGQLKTPLIVAEKAAEQQKAQGALALLRANA